MAAALGISPASVRRIWKRHGLKPHLVRTFKVVNIELYTMFSLPHISQIYLFYRAQLVDGIFAPGGETEAVSLFHEADVPWDELAFPVIRDTLRHYFRDRLDNQFQVHTGDIEISRDRR